MYRIVQLPDDAPDLPEQLGTKAKFWYTQKDIPYLFKQGRPTTGENWSEKVACELCELLALPHADYNFAVWREQRGVVSPSMVPENGRLILGNELLGRVYTNYPSDARRGVNQHTVKRAAALMESRVVGLPLAWQPLVQTNDAFDVFVGYLMLDAWIGNSDRHHENWGLILTSGGTIHLAPTFDHASSLGCHETEANRKERLTTRDSGRSVEHYVAKARSALYLNPSCQKPLGTLEAFTHAAQLHKQAAQTWLDQLQNVTLPDCAQIFAQIPPDEISEISAEFALKILHLNRNRLLALGKELT